MFGFKVSYLKWIIIVALLFSVLTLVNNNLLKNSDEQKDGFEDQENKNKLNDTVDKLISVVSKLEEVAETFKNANGNVKDDQDDVDDADYDDEDDNDDVDDEAEVSLNNTKKRENFRRKSHKKKSNKSKEKFQQPLVDKFSNYTTGVASSFGGDYLLLN